MKKLSLTLLVSLAACASGNGAPPEDLSTPLVADAYQPQPYVKIRHPEWSKNAVIYQLNTRQFSDEGTFVAAQEQLPRLRDLGVDIIWLMPIHPIGEENRKGKLGSPYSVKDYFAVNPEFGTLADLRNFVNAAHELDMYVILDWVANHTAWDNPMVRDHPEWYERDWKGDFHPTPWWDWSDIIDLDYDQPGLRRYMTDALKYWVTEADIDGYRCDVAGYVPVDFWDNARHELDAIKPVFMLAEWESRDLHARAFDMSYAWSWHNAMHDVAMGKADTTAFYRYYSANESAFPEDAIRMTFISNHDKNSWEGTQFELFGDALMPAIVLSVVGEGMPLLYNGQEAGNQKRLEFFEKDPIEWREHPIGALYKKLFALKKQNSALWNAAWGATMIHVPNSSPRQVFSFLRQNDTDKVFAVFNFSAEPREVTFMNTLHHGEYQNYFAGEKRVLDATTALEIKPWGWRIYVK